MLLNAEIKDDSFSELPRQTEAEYAPPAQTFLRSDAATGQKYIDLNAAAKTYSGAWLMGSQNVVVSVYGMRGQWSQWCPIPAGIPDGILMRGNVMYQNPDGSYRRSTDSYEGTIRTYGGVRRFEGLTQHTFYGRNFPGGQLRVSARIDIPLTQQLANNPMIPVRQPAPSPPTNYYNAGYPQPAQTYGAPPATYGSQVPADYGNSTQEPDMGF